jgi:hypothetical protein
VGDFKYCFWCGVGGNNSQSFKYRQWDFRRHWRLTEVTHRKAIGLSLWRWKFPSYLRLLFVVVIFAVFSVDLGWLVQIFLLEANSVYNELDRTVWLVGGGSAERKIVLGRRRGEIRKELMQVGVIAVALNYEFHLFF